MNAFSRISSKVACTAASGVLALALAVGGTVVDTTGSSGQIVDIGKQSCTDNGGQTGNNGQADGISELGGSKYSQPILDKNDVLGVGSL